MSNCNILRQAGKIKMRSRLGWFPARMGVHCSAWERRDPRVNNSRAASWRGQISRWGPAVLMMAVIFTASSFPSRDLPSFGLWDRLVKKGGHMVGYALLAIAYTHGLASGARPTRRQLSVAVALAGLYAITDEFHQLFVAGRGAAATSSGGTRLPRRRPTPPTLARTPSRATRSHRLPSRRTSKAARPRARPSLA